MISRVQYFVAMSSQLEATYLYELYPNLTAIKIAEEMINKNRGAYDVDGLPQQEDNLGQHVAKFVQDNKYIPGDCIQIIRKAICDYFQSLQNLIVFGSNSIVKNDIDSSINYFPNKNNIIKYDTNNTDGFQIRTNTHRDRPAASLSGFLIKKLTSGRNEYYHTSYTSKGANFFFSNKDGIVLALFEPKNMISQVKKRKRVDESTDEGSTIAETLEGGTGLTPPTSSSNSPRSPRPSTSPTNIGSRQGSPRTSLDTATTRAIGIEQTINDFFDLYSQYDEIIDKLINFNLDNLPNEENTLVAITTIINSFTNYLHGIYDNYRMNYIGMHEYIITDNLVLFTPYNQLYINNLIFFNKDIENDFYILGLEENIKVCPDTDDDKFSELNNDENYALQLYNYVENMFYTNLFDEIDKLESQEDKDKILDELDLDDKITNSINEIVSSDYENNLIDDAPLDKLNEKIQQNLHKIVDEIIIPINSDSENIDDAIIPGGSKLHKRTFKKILRNNKKRKTIKHKKSLK